MGRKTTKSLIKLPPSSGDLAYGPRGSFKVVKLLQRSQSMRATYWQPFGPIFNQLQRFQGDVNRLFDHWIGSDSPGSTPVGFPPVNIWEEGDQVRVQAELPGLDPATLEVLVSQGNQLTIKGERKKVLPDKAVWHRQERGAGAFSRTVPLPFLVDADHVEARLENGLLNVTLAKHASARPRKIAIKAE